MSDEMSAGDGPTFSEWLRAQMKAKRMSQRHLQLRSGVDHTTISRLLRGEHAPSLETATKLARGLRALHDESDAPGYLRVISAATSHPTARVEYALRADELLDESWLEDLAADLTDVFNVSEEKMRGK